MVPFWVSILIRHLIFRGPKKGPEGSQPLIYNGEEDGNCYSILGLYRDNGEENEN